MGDDQTDEPTQFQPNLKHYSFYANKIISFEHTNDMHYIEAAKLYV